MGSDSCQHPQLACAELNLCAMLTWATPGQQRLAPPCAGTSCPGLFRPDGSPGPAGISQGISRASGVDKLLATQAFQAWLGYYNGTYAT